MTTLTPSFKIGDRCYELERSQRLSDKRSVAIYSVKKQHTGTALGFETVILRQRSGGSRTINGKTIVFNAGIRYPTDSEFGAFGWFYVEHTNALAKFNAILNWVQV